MIQRISKSVLAALVAGGAVAGCATTVDMGGPLLHYRYNYDSRPVVSESTVTVPAPVVTYREPGIVYRESEVTAYPESGVVYRTYRDPLYTYRGPTVVYGYQSPSVPYKDSGQ